MNSELIRVREFARNCGCTPQNIYGHLKTYAADLEGHTFKGSGRQGVLLDQYAQDFLRSIMYPKEISADTELMDEINRLRGQLLQLGMENTQLASRLAATEGERDRVLLECGQHQKALAAAAEEREAQAQELDRAHKEAQEAAQRAEEAHRQAQELQAALDAAEARETALMGRSLWQRIRNKGV